jgi:iron complex transport system ATP-binding protein
MNDTAAPPLLRADGLALAAGTRVLLRGLDLDVAPGTLWCVLGPNGSGKTTLLHTLAGLQRPVAGRIRLDGRPLDDWRPDALARRRGLLPQALHDAFAASVLDTVLLGRHPHLARWDWEGDADRARAQAALAAVELDALAARDVTTLSGGERQRVGVAALLAQDPTLMLLDEPLAHLDLRHQLALLEHLRALALDAGRAVLLSIHDLNLARRYATHALLLAGDGGVPVQGPVADAMRADALAATFGHPLTAATVGGRVVYLPA